MNITEEQNDFLRCVKPLIKTLPESKKCISNITGVPLSEINCFLNSKATISQYHFHRLFEYFNCTYDYHQWEDGHAVNDFRLSGGYTTFPSTKKEIVDLYEQNSHGGDLVFAHELVHQNGYISSHTRYILLHTCYYLYTLMIIKNRNDLVDTLIDQDKLINFGGSRAISDALRSELTRHEFNISDNPETRRELDRSFFADKDLVFSMIPLATMTHKPG